MSVRVGQGVKARREKSVRVAAVKTDLRASAENVGIVATGQGGMGIVVIGRVVMAGVENGVDVASAVGVRSAERLAGRKWTARIW